MQNGKILSAKGIRRLQATSLRYVVAGLLDEVSQGSSKSFGTKRLQATSWCRSARQGIAYFRLKYEFCYESTNRVRTKSYENDYLGAI